MTKAELLNFLRGFKYAVEASVTVSGSPQAAVIGIVVSDDLEIFFDTITTSRKAVNFRAHARAALVVGGPEGGDRTVQLEGRADEPVGADLERLKELYFGTFPDGRERALQPDIMYFRIRPDWLRYSDFRTDPWLILEWDAPALARL